MREQALIQIDNVQYFLLFDEYGVLDTTTRVKDQKAMVSTHRHVKNILRNIDRFKLYAKPIAA